MNFRNISSWCIRNPVAPIVLFVGLMLAGLVSFASMQVNSNPDIDFPAAQVTVVQPGAAPNEMETQITQRVESAIRGVNGVDEINCTVSEGTSSTFVQFQIGTPTDRAVNDVRNAIAQIRSNFPKGSRSRRSRASTSPAARSCRRRADHRHEPRAAELVHRQYGVQAAARDRGHRRSSPRGGGVDRKSASSLDPAALQAQGITAAQVNQQLRQSNINAPAAAPRSRARSKRSACSATLRRLPARRRRRSRFRAAASSALPTLAQVKDSYSEQRRSPSRTAARSSPSTSARKGYSDVTAYDDAWKELNKIRKENPKVHFAEIYNNVEYTKKQYHSAMEGLVEGAILAVLVVLLFLRDIRATPISALAIPLSAIPAFWFMTCWGSR